MIVSRSRSNIFLLLLIIMLPSFWLVVFKASSLASGLLISAFIVIFFAKSKYFFRLEKRLTVTILVILFFLFLNTFFAYFNSGNKKVLTFFALLLVIPSAFVFSRKLIECSAASFDKTIASVLFLLITLGWMGYFSISVHGNYLLAAKPIPPFSEHSHYALAIGPVLVAYTLIATKKMFFLALSNIVMMAIIFPNLTLLLFCTLAILIFVRVHDVPNQIVLFPFIILFVLALNALLSESEYFHSRVSLSDTTNITALVWVQGWELAYKNIIDTNGFGVGFQLLGSDESQLPDISYEIKSLGGKFFNIEDGGFLASKIISELGFIGLFICFAYLKFLLIFIFRFGENRKSLGNNSALNSLLKKKIILDGFVFAFLVEFFFRGYGYFSPGLYLTLSFLMASFTISHRLKGASKNHPVRG